MIFGPVLERFVERSPACVMIRGTMENAIGPEFLDQVFEQTAPPVLPGIVVFFGRKLAGPGSHQGKKIRMHVETQQNYAAP